MDASRAVARRRRVAYGAIARAAAFALGAVLVACGPVGQSGASPTRPAFCPRASDGVQEIRGTPAGPYVVAHPSRPSPGTPTVVFLPGGSGAKRNALRVWDTMLSGARGIDGFRVVIPFWPDVTLDEDPGRTIAVVDEVLTCFGGDAKRVHLGGFSNGGHAAFDLMLELPERFVTLLGAPGEFQLSVKAADLARLKGKAVFNGIGELDDEFWHKGVRDAHEMLTNAGVESVYVEFAGQRHAAGEGFPKDVLFEFWVKHSGGERR